MHGLHRARLGPDHDIRTLQGPLLRSRQLGPALFQADSASVPGELENAEELALFCQHVHLFGLNALLHVTQTNFPVLEDGIRTNGRPRCPGEQPLMLF